MENQRNLLTICPEKSVVWLELTCKVKSAKSESKKVNRLYVTLNFVPIKKKNRFISQNNLCDALVKCIMQGGIRSHEVIGLDKLLFN